MIFISSFLKLLFTPPACYPLRDGLSCLPKSLEYPYTWESSWENAIWKWVCFGADWKAVHFLEYAFSSAFWNTCILHHLSNPGAEGKCRPVKGWCSLSTNEETFCRFQKAEVYHTIWFPRSMDYIDIAVTDHVRRKFITQSNLRKDGI